MPSAAVATPLLARNTLPGRPACTVGGEKPPSAGWLALLLARLLQSTSGGIARSVEVSMIAPATAVVVRRSLAAAHQQTPLMR